MQYALIKYAYHFVVKLFSSYCAVYICGIYALYIIESTRGSLSIKILGWGGGGGGGLSLPNISRQGGSKIYSLHASNVNI